MSDAGRRLLRAVLLLEYDGLKARLTRRLGSADRAADALQDAWLRLEHAEPSGPVDRPYPYLLRIAYNIALKSRSRERDIVTLDDARARLGLVEDAPDPERIVLAQSEMALVQQALAELTPRRREILLASRVDGVALRELAVRFNISQRMVEMELKSALVHCGRRLGRKIVQRFGPHRDRGINQETDIDDDEASRR
jgi:RNA polymerase sigma-70 factor, ECF subfamily